MTSPLRIVVTQGHRNTSGGNPAEAARTPALANAIVAALARAGHEAVNLQNDDGSRDNWFSGSLDAVARKVMAYHQARPVDLLLDIHIEGDPANTPGVFAIVPDGTGLKTRTPYTGSDRAGRDSRTYRLARAIAHGVARATGLKLRTKTVLEPGVMSERSTHVGADLGWRLAMFGYTAPARERMARSWSPPWPRAASTRFPAGSWARRSPATRSGGSPANRGSPRRAGACGRAAPTWRERTCWPCRFESARA